MNPAYLNAPVDPRWEVKVLRKENKRLREENERLQREASEYLRNWVASADAAAARNVRLLMEVSRDES